MSIGKSLRYAFYVIFHPFDGFYDLKHEKRGTMSAAYILLALTTLTYISSRQFTAFLFNFNNLNDLRLVMDVATVLVLFLLWCTANWCLTSLMDGEGSFKDIVMATSYSLVPYILLNIPLIILSYCFITDESAFYYVVQSVALVWSAGLLFFSTMTVHQYSLGKTILTVICILLGMAIMLFLALLFFSVIQQIVSFVTIVYREVSLRM